MSDKSNISALENHCKAYINRNQEAQDKYLGGFYEFYSLFTMFSTFFIQL